MGHVLSAKQYFKTAETASFIWGPRWELDYCYKVVFSDYFSRWDSLGKIQQGSWKSCQAQTPLNFFSDPKVANIKVWKYSKYFKNQSQEGSIKTLHLSALLTKSSLLTKLECFPPVCLKFCTKDSTGEGIYRWKFKTKGNKNDSDICIYINRFKI